MAAVLDLPLHSTSLLWMVDTLTIVIGTMIFFGTALATLIALLSALVAREMVRPPRHTVGYALAKGLPTDPGDLGLQFEEWWLDRADGSRLPVWEIQGSPDQGVTGSNVQATAVFVHGWGHSRIDMLAHMEAWRGRFARQVFYDLRGHGDAEGSLSKLGYREDEDLLALLERLGDGPFVLVGYSMGAVIALVAAAQEHPTRHRIAHVFTYAPYADFHASLRGRMKRAGQPTRPMTDIAMFWMTITGRPPRSLMADDLRAIRCPVTIVDGKDDIVSPPEQAQWIEEILTSREGEEATSAVHRIVISNVGHELALLSLGEAHDAAVERVCASLTGGR